MCSGFCILPWGSDNGVRLNVLTASYFDPLSPLYFDTFDKQLGFMQNLNLLNPFSFSHQFGSFKSSMCLSLCTALKSLHLMQCLKPEACRRFRSWTGTYENDSSVKQKNCFNAPMSAMHVLARWSLRNDLHRVSVFVCVRILHCFHSAHWKSRSTWCGIASLPAVTVLSLARTLRLWSTNQAWAS